MVAALACLLFLGQLDRTEFVTRLKTLDWGATPSEVESLLGPPDDVLVGAQSLPEGKNDKSITWCYGTRGHLTLPTLGSVTFTGGVVSNIQGKGGHVPPPGLVPEVTMRKMLTRLDPWMPPMLWRIQGANMLRTLSAEAAITVLEEYDRVTFGRNSRESVGDLARTLLVPRETSQDESNPIVFVDDLPISMQFGTIFAGNSIWLDLSEQSSGYRVSPHRLHPPKDPFLSVQKLLDNKKWLSNHAEGDDIAVSRSLIASFLMNEVISFVSTVSSVGGDGRFSFDFVNDHRRFEEAHRMFLSFKPRWDDGLQMYVRGDGTHLSVIGP